VVAEIANLCIVQALEDARPSVLLSMPFSQGVNRLVGTNLHFLASGIRTPSCHYSGSP
jgi:hypothetical protein